MEIRPAAPNEFPAIGELLVDAYCGLEGYPMSDRYEDELRNVAERAADSLVLVAVDGERVVGTITFVPDAASSAAEFDDSTGAGIRMLAVAPAARRAGLGRALTEACLEVAQARRRRTVYLHTTSWMPAARRMYEAMGFVHDPNLDWTPEPDISLRGYRLALPVIR